MSESSVYELIVFENLFDKVIASWEKKILFDIKNEM